MNSETVPVTINLNSKMYDIFKTVADAKDLKVEEVILQMIEKSLSESLSNFILN